MGRTITAADILGSKCGKLNQHLIKAAPAKKKQPAKRRSSKALRWLKKNLHFWAIEKGEELTTEEEFAPGRKYASDWALPKRKILIEYEGGIYMNRGGHNSPTGIQRDIDKYALAERLGFTVIRLTAKNYENALQLIEEMIKIKSND